MTGSASAARRSWGGGAVPARALYDGPSARLPGLSAVLPAREQRRIGVYFEKFRDRVALPRGGRQAALDALAARYAARLEAYCLRDPFQWYNFFDFWAQSPAPEVPAQS